MIKKTVTYVDLNGNQRTEDLHFNLSKLEIAKMERDNGDKYSDKLRRAAESNDGGLIMSAFENLIAISYGEKSEDGKHFIKVRNGENLSEAFMQTPAYEALFEQLLNNPEEAKAFMLGVIPPLPEGTNIDSLAIQK